MSDRSEGLRGERLRPQRSMMGREVNPSNNFFTPIGPAPPMTYVPEAVKPVPTNPEPSSSQTFAKSNGIKFPTPSTSSLINSGRSPPSPHAPYHHFSPPQGSQPFGSPPGRSQKRKPINGDMIPTFCEMEEPQRKVHLTEDYVAQTMSELYISNPKPKVARRNFNRDVSEAMNLETLGELEDRFSSHAINDEYNLPPVRSRKLPTRNRSPQLRLTLHKDLKNVRTASAIPDTIISRYRPSCKQGSTALVLWRPPGGIVPDVITSALKPPRSRTRCFSEVTSTPYSSHENLVEGSSCSLLGGRSSKENLSMSTSPVSAEAPELSSSQEDLSGGINLQRRNSAPEMSEPLPFLDDDGSMEL